MNIPPSIRSFTDDQTGLSLAGKLREGLVFFADVAFPYPPSSSWLMFFSLRRSAFSVADDQRKAYDPPANKLIERMASVVCR